MSMLNICPRCKKTFDNWQEYNDHSTTFKHRYKQMDPKEKARIVAQVESRLSPFLVGHGVLEAKKTPTTIVIERFEQPALMSGLPEPEWGTDWSKIL